MVPMTCRPAVRSARLSWRATFAMVAVLALCAASRAGAGDFTTSSGGAGFDPGLAGFTPRVPISGLARAASWFDPARLHLTSTVSVGSGWGAGTTSALQVTTLNYQFGRPLSMSVSVGNTFGTAGFSGAKSGNPFFLEGFDLNWRPTANSLFRVEMHDVRSPLQISDPWGSAYGYGDRFRTPY